MRKVLQINVDDLGNGGVFALVKNVIANKKDDNIKIDIASIEKFTNENNIKFLNDFGCNVIYLGGNYTGIKKYLNAKKELINYLKQNSYDYVHIHSDLSFKLWFWAKCAKKAGVKNIILHSHASGVDGNNRKLKEFLHKIFRKKLKNLGTCFVTCSDLAREWMFPNVNFEKVITIKNGVDLNKFKYNESKRLEVRKELGIKDELLIGHLGRFAYQKNHHYLIDIFETVHKQIASKLLLIGEGELLQEIKEIVKNKNLDNDVIFYGVTNRVPELFQAMDCFVLPSHFEGLPVAGVEAQASGLPTLFSDKITKEAKLLDSTEFLSIEQDNISNWAEKILKSKSIVRKDDYNLLKEQKFDISDTVKQFIDLYRL